MAIAALRQRKTSLVEKPLARTYAEAKPIIDAAKKLKDKVMVGMNLRYRPDAMILRSLISAGEIGDPFYVKCGWIRRQSSSEKWFTRKEESGGGVIIDLVFFCLIFHYGFLNYPPVTSVTTQNFSLNTKNVEDSSISMLRCKNDSVISMEASWSLPVEKDHFYFNVYGTKGNCFIESLQNSIRKLKISSWILHHHRQKVY